MIALKVLCAVDGINVHFYLPHRKGGFNKLLWPPRSDPSLGWNYFDMNLGEGGSDFILAGEDASAVEDKPSFLDDSVLHLIIQHNSVAATYPTVKVSQVEARNRNLLISLKRENLKSFFQRLNLLFMWKTLHRCEVLLI